MQGLCAAYFDPASLETVIKRTIVHRNLMERRPHSDEYADFYRPYIAAAPDGPIRDSTRTNTLLRRARTRESLRNWSRNGMRRGTPPYYCSRDYRTTHGTVADTSAVSNSPFGAWPGSLQATRSIILGFCGAVFGTIAVGTISEIIVKTVVVHRVRKQASPRDPRRSDPGVGQRGTLRVRTRTG